MSRQLTICNIPISPGLNVSPQEWEEKKQVLANFARQLFHSTSASTASPLDADPSIPCVSLKADVPASWDLADEDVSYKKYIVGDGQVEYPRTFAVCLGPSTIHGRGMFATKDFKESEIVEVCPTLEVHHSCIGGILEDYVYYGDKKDHRVIVMGYGMMYNSWSSANLWYYRDHDGNFVFVASKPIKNGEELLIDYGPEWWGSRDSKKKLGPNGEAEE